MKMLHTILQNGSSYRSWLPYTALLTGFFLLLCALQLYLNLHYVLHHSGRSDGFDYLVINKKITNRMMGDNSLSYFSANELQQVQQAPAIDDMARIVSNTFPIAASTTGNLGFYTQLFFESLPDEYLDLQPDNWFWAPGQRTVPVILSADFLNLYNFGFALSQGLPQLSEESIKALNFELSIGEGPKSETYTAMVAGFTRRYSSVLVPAPFMHYANHTFGKQDAEFTSRVVLKTREADHPGLTRFLRDHGYVTRQEHMSLSKLKPILHGVFAALGFIGLFVLSLSLMALTLFLELQVSRHTSQLKLLAMLGYPPSKLQSAFTLRTLRTVAILTAISLLLLSGMQYVVAQSLHLMAYEVPFRLHWIVWILGCVLPAFVFALLNRRVRRLISPLY